MMSRFSLALALVATSAFAFAADKEVEELLAKMRKAYQSVESVSLTAKSRGQFLPEGEALEVKMDYARTNKLRLAFKFGSQQVRRVSDGKKVYTWAEPAKGEKSEPDVSDVSMDALGGDAPINLESMCFFDWKRQLSTEKGANMEKSEFKLIKSESWNGRSWIVLEETAHGQNVFARYFIDPSTYFIWRCDVKTLDKKNPFMEVHLVDLQLNPKLPADTFKAPFERAS